MNFGNIQYHLERKKTGMENERYLLNKQFAQMLKGGVIMDVTTPEQAKIAEEAGACAVQALEKSPPTSGRRAASRMSDPKRIKSIPEGGQHPRHGQMPHRPYRRGADPGGH